MRHDSLLYKVSSLNSVCKTEGHYIVQGGIGVMFSCKYWGCCVPHIKCSSFRNKRNGTASIKVFSIIS